jgi:hypothetical protein
VALQLISLAEMKAYSGLAEVQALIDATLEVLERQAIDLVESELSRRITLDTEDQEKEVSGSGMKMVALPERLDSLTSVVINYILEDSLDISDDAAIAVNGWILKFSTYHIRDSVTVTGKWGIDPPQKLLDVVMDLCEALAVRKGDEISRRNQVSPWGDVSDGSLRANRSQSRNLTAEELVRYDLKLKLKDYYRPTRWEFI